MSKSHTDQADALRKLVQQKEEQFDISSLPSRKEVHQKKRRGKEEQGNQKNKAKIKFPIVRLLLLLFLLIIVVAIFSPLWLEKVYQFFGY